ncbi:hypothetical protein TWF481_008566 [Arthrobotrys musiformis]|uniref:Uncharacterized protein n=1 Tax=Arthrobotrys musiformis TaxID=47236 RepID=A0AAV9W9E9_9PEZI
MSNDIVLKGGGKIGEGYSTPLIPHKNSLPLPPHLLPFYKSRIEPRIHASASDEEKIANEYYEEWVRYGGRPVGSRGSIADIGGAASVQYPECDPERLRKVSDLAAILSLDDDFGDGGYGASPEDDEYERTCEIILKQLKSKLYVETISKDYELARLFQKYQVWSAANKEIESHLSLQKIETVEAHLDATMVAKAST